MQKLIILDGETGIATILELPIDIMEDSVEEWVEEKGYNTSSCHWMVALEVDDRTLEINDTTI